MQNHPPQNMQSVLWSSDIDTLDLENDKKYIIHQTFAYGALDDIVWLFKTYPVQTISTVFRTVPYKDYRPKRFNLIKNYILNLQHTFLDERLYVKNTPRNI